MPAPYTQMFALPDGTKLTSVVIDQTEFDDFLIECRAALPDQFTVEAMQATRQQKLLLLGRGTKTQSLFDRYHVGTNKMGVIVRGAGPELAQRIIGKCGGSS